jgi:catechol 2,3-dioxygenase-like lactoylglutathione lyase family enzyme
VCDRQTNHKNQLHNETGSRKKEIKMLGDKNAVANLAVRNLDSAKKFYADTIGLKPIGGEGEELVVFRSGDSTINVYRSDYAGTNKATAVTWTIDDVEGAVQALKAKGVKFEHYDLPGMTRRGDVHIGGEMKVAWFKDRMATSSISPIGKMTL